MTSAESIGVFRSVQGVLGCSPYTPYQDGRNFCRAHGGLWDAATDACPRGMEIVTAVLHAVDNRRGEQQTESGICHGEG